MEIMLERALACVARGNLVEGEAPGAALEHRVRWEAACVGTPSDRHPWPREGEHPRADALLGRELGQ
ncbi:hypothetical protein [Ferrimonas balearica]|uniref:hypothetical protein n=1 Tax=Ferrimonas balearica TaxID=44012 RepID=UPI001C998A86|nr:hypothetical protein [Ferrimonas balearica]MBY5992173.1 hypothetical protein [Ferrimonas balearica]